MKWLALALAITLVACTSTDTDTSAVDTPGAGDAVNSGDTAFNGAGGIRHGYMAIHLDPSQPPANLDNGLINLSRPAAYFATLLELVVAADLHDHKLTIMFTPHWARYVTMPMCTPPDDGDADDHYEYRGVEYNDCLALVRATEGYGHEIALHHHPFSYERSNWDGFTDLDAWHADRNRDGTDEQYTPNSQPPDPFYLGTVAEMSAIIGEIPAGGEQALVSCTTEEFPPQLRYYAHGGTEPYINLGDPGGLVSQPCAGETGGVWVWHIGMRHFLSDETQNAVLKDELRSAFADFADSPESWTIGFVSHAKNAHFTDTGMARYVELFATLKDTYGITLEPLATVVSYYDYTTDDPAVADPALHCP